MNSLFPDICSVNLAQSKAFYETLLGMRAVFEIDWYIQMQAPDNETIQLAFVAKDHPSVPEGYRLDPSGVVITVEMDAVDPVYEQAVAAKLPIVHELRDEPWGQRHFMACDPNGLLVDLVQMIEPSEEFAKHFQ